MADHLNFTLVRLPDRVRQGGGAIPSHLRENCQKFAGLEKTGQRSPELLGWIKAGHEAILSAVCFLD